MIRCANPNATEKARELLSYLYETAGRKIITGQHTQTKPMEEISYIKEITLKSMSLVKFTYMTSRPSIQLPILSRPLTVLKMPKKKLETKLIFSALSFS